MVVDDLLKREGEIKNGEKKGKKKEILFLGRGCNIICWSRIAGHTHTQRERERERKREGV